jgi:hypothetical protein
MKNKKRIAILEEKVAYLESLLENHLYEVAYQEFSNRVSEKAKANYPDLGTLHGIIPEIADWVYDAKNGKPFPGRPLPKDDMSWSDARNYIADIYEVTTEDIDTFMEIDGRYT